MEHLSTFAIPCQSPKEDDINQAVDQLAEDKMDKILE
jgi:hypothetical protein